MKLKLKSSKIHFQRKTYTIQSATNTTMKYHKYRVFLINSGKGSPPQLTIIYHHSESAKATGGPTLTRMTMILIVECFVGK